MADPIITKIGDVSAYLDAVAHGFEGTRAEFGELLANSANYAQSAESAASAASAAAATATTKAMEATTAATAAQTAKTQTEAAASQALTDISTAESGAISAVQTEGATQTANATAQAQAAATSATTASTKASEASASATTATTKATEAAASATSAANAASAAQGVLESIPEDYSDLSKDVDKLKADLDVQIESINGCLDEIENALAPVYIEGETIAHTTNNGWYISQMVQLNSQNNQNFKVSTVPVEAGKRYRIRGTTRLQADYPVVAFSNTDVMSVGEQGTLIILGSTTATTYDQYYDAAEDGYLWIASFSTREILSITEVAKEYTNLPKRRTLKVQLFGDSITDNTWGDLTTWVNYMADFMPVYDLTIVNSAIGGSRLSKSSSTTNAVENLIEDGTTVQTDADLIVIWAGTNDWGGGGPELGTFLGTYGIYGAVKNIITTLSTNAPTALILFATPLQRHNNTDAGREVDAQGTPINSRGYTLRQFADAIIETCQYYGVPCIDMNGSSGINRLNIRTFTSDGLHPNTNGDKRIAHEMCKKIDSLFGFSQ